MAVLIYMGQETVQFNGGGRKTVQVTFPQPFGGGISPNVTAALQGFSFDGQGVNINVEVTAISIDSFNLNFVARVSAGSVGAVSAQWIATGVDGK